MRCDEVCSCQTFRRWSTGNGNQRQADHPKRSAVCRTKTSWIHALVETVNGFVQGLESQAACATQR